MSNELNIIMNELEELNKLQNELEQEDVISFSSYCGGFLTIVCC